MAGSVNKVILVGNVGKDPEIRSTNSGKKIANFSLATSETWRDKSTGDKKDRTEWHRVCCYNDNLTDIIDKYVKKGSKLFVEGSLSTRKWTDDKGIERYSTEVVIQGFGGSITLLDSKRDDRGGGYDPEMAERNTRSEGSAGSAGTSGGSSYDEPMNYSPPPNGGRPASTYADDEIPF